MRRAKIVFFQLVFGALLLEACLRFYNPLPFRLKGDSIVLPIHEVYEFDNRRSHKLDPMTRHTKNSLGFRGPDPPRDFDRRLTVITIGGSTTESLFLSDGKTWTDQLSRRLADVFPDVWVNNAGLDGQSTYGHLVLLREAIVRLRPKVVLFLVGTNDVDLDAGTTYDIALTPSRSGLARLQAAIVNHSALARLVQNLYRAFRTHKQGFGHGELDPTTATRVVLDEAVMQATLGRQTTHLAQYRERLVRIVQLCRANAMVPVLITQPALFGETVDPATGVDLSTIQVNGRGNGTLEWRLLERYNEFTRAVGAELRVQVIDLARELPKDSRLFYDFIHFTNEGSILVGDIVFRHMCPALLSQFGRPATCAA